MYIITHIQCRSTVDVYIHMTLSLCPQADGAEKYRSKRKRLGLSSSRSAAKMQKTEVTVYSCPYRLEGKVLFKGNSCQILFKTPSTLVRSPELLYPSD